MTGALFFHLTLDTILESCLREEGGAPVTHRGLFSALPLIALVVLMTFVSLVATPAWSQSSSADTQQGTPSGAGMQAGAAVSTILYFPFKAAFEIGRAHV